MKSIIELCKELPASEGELRERATEFNVALAESLELASGPHLTYHADQTCGHSSCWRCASNAPKYLHNIADAKAATDAMAARGLRLTVEMIIGKLWIAILYDGDVTCITAKAPTEELARAACALLASEALKGKDESGAT